MANKTMNVVATAISGSQVNVSWDDVATLTGEVYDVERNGVIVGNDYAGAHTVGSPYADTGLSPGTAYTYRVRAVGDFTPLGMSGLVAWYDFSDIASLWKDTARTVAVAADADVIKGVTDKSGGGFHLSEATNGPAYKVSIQNSLSIARFDGTNDQLKVSATSGVTNVTLFVVFKMGTRVATNGVVAVIDTTPSVVNYDYADPGMFAISHSNTANNPDLNVLDSVAGTYVLHLGDFGTTFAISSTTMTSSDNSANSYRNGAVVATGGTSEARVASDAGVVLGARWLGGVTSNWAADDIAEVVLYNGVLSAANHNLVGNYLATKWGLTWTTVV